MPVRVFRSGDEGAKRKAIEESVRERKADETQREKDYYAKRWTVLKNLRAEAYKMIQSEDGLGKGMDLLEDVELLMEKLRKKERMTEEQRRAARAAMQVLDKEKIPPTWDEQLATVERTARIYTRRVEDPLGSVLGAYDNEE
jgi:hypothetical protein